MCYEISINFVIYTVSRGGGCGGGGGGGKGSKGQKIIQTGGVKKPHRYRPGTVALRDI